MITGDDVNKIRNALKPDFDNLEKKFDQKLDAQTKNFDQKLDAKLGTQTAEIKKYIHEGVNAVVDGIDNLLQEYQFDPRIKKLEKIHPGGRHRQID